MTAPLAVILAAGKSKRMKSAVPKVLHEICGRPMIEYVLDAARAVGTKRIVVVVGHRADLVRQALEHHRDIDFADQTEQLGTGHAVMMCEQQLQGHEGPALVLAGDTPLLRRESLAGLLEDQRTAQAACVIGTAITEANEGLGRVVRGEEGEFVRIVEQKDATPEELAIREINTGCYAFDTPTLLSALKRIRPENKQGEYYLTDCPAVLKSDGRTVLASAKLTIEEALGVNTRAQLAQVERAIQGDTVNRLLEAGVTIVSPEQCYIDPRATIGADTVIHPFTTIRGPAVIGERCQIGPHALVDGPLELPDETIVEPFSIHRSK